ncbi:MAG TPA: serine/threonine-protein kinase [Kofleriaceae bacterium]
MSNPVATSPFVDKDYLLGEVLGVGGMGVVYSAIQLSIARRVAIKIPHPDLAADPSVNRRFRSEADACGRIGHRNVARMIELGGRDGTLYLAMEYVGGTPLDKLVLDQGPMEPELAVNLCGQLLDGLHEIHSNGIVHADIKSANVLVEPLPDGTRRAVVIDFGLARFANDPCSHDPRLLSGTPDYLAPELIQGTPPTFASDIYAAGVVLYELLTGTTPFSGGSSTEILARQVHDAAVPPSLRSPEQTIPDAIEDVVMRALAKDPAARFVTAALFAAALRAATSTATAHVEPARIGRGSELDVFSAETATRDWHGRRPSIVRVAAALVGDSTRIVMIRAAIAAALASGDDNGVVSSYLELVRALIDARQMKAAAAELERGLVLLRPRIQVKATPPATWRLQLCLAALYSGLGDPARARGAAILGKDDAVRAASIVGEDRARALLVRLAGHSA